MHDQTSTELCVPVFSTGEKTLRRFNIYVMFYGSSIAKSNIISQLKSPVSWLTSITISSKKLDTEPIHTTVLCEHAQVKN